MSQNSFNLYSLDNNDMLNITRNTWYNIQCFGTNRLSLPMSTCKKKNENLTQILIPDLHSGLKKL